MRPRLTASIVTDCRLLVAGGHATAAQLAEDLDVPLRTVQHLLVGATWRAAPGPLRPPRKRCARLNEHTVRRILRDGRASPAVAETHGCAESTVRHIRTGRIWAHVRAS